MVAASMEATTMSEENQDNLDCIIQCPLTMQENIRVTHALQRQIDRFQERAGRYRPMAKERGDFDALVVEHKKLFWKLVNAREELAQPPWCAECQEEHCLVSQDGTCAMIRRYLAGVKLHIIDDLSTKELRKPSKPVWEWVRAKPCDTCQESEDECWARVTCHELEAWRKKQPNTRKGTQNESQ